MARSFQVIPTITGDSIALPINAKDQSWTILCDFDGTISAIDVTDALLISFAQDGWEDVEAAWRDGKIGSQQCMAAQVALLDVGRAELDARVAEIEIDPAFGAFVATARDLGIALGVVSDGLDYVIRSILNRHGLGDLPIDANALVQVSDRRWRLDFPNARADCAKASGTCKCALLAEARHDRRVLFIGDGASDFCVSHRADFVLAKGRLLDYAYEEGIPHAAIMGFGDALKWLKTLDVRPSPIAPSPVC